MTIKDKSIDLDPLEVNMGDLGGTDDWEDDDLESIDDLDDSLDDIEEDDDEDESTDDQEDDSDDSGDDESSDDDDSDSDDDDLEDEDDEDSDDEEEEETVGEEDENPDVEKKDPAKDTESKDNRVPLSRLNKEVDKRRVLENRIAELVAAADNPAPKAKAKEAPVVDDTPAFTLDDFKEMSNAILDGNDEKALEKFSNMTQAQVNKAVNGVRDEARNDARSEIQADRDTTDLLSVAADITKQYPEFDSNSDSADKAMIEDVLDLRDAFETKGLSPAKALEKATRLVALDNKLTDRSVKAVEKKPTVKKPNIKKKLELAKKEKGKLQGNPSRAKALKKPLAELSDDEFGAATEEALAKARGDFV